MPVKQKIRDGNWYGNGSAYHLHSVVYSLISVIPKHRVTHFKLSNNKIRYWKLLGHYYYVRPDENLAGNVNGDTDIRFVKKNFLKKGPDASKSQTAAEKSKSGTLADILKKLGLTPKK